MNDNFVFRVGDDNIKDNPYGIDGEKLFIKLHEVGKKKLTGTGKRVDFDSIPFTLEEIMGFLRDQKIKEEDLEKAVNAMIKNLKWMKKKSGIRTIFKFNDDFLQKAHSRVTKGGSSVTLAVG